MTVSRSVLVLDDDADLRIEVADLLSTPGIAYRRPPMRAISGSARWRTSMSCCSISVCLQSTASTSSIS